MKIVGCLSVIAFVLSSCKTTQKPLVSEAKVALTRLAIPDSALEGLSFKFCPEKKSFSLVNTMWLSYFAALTYTEEEMVEKKLREFGFEDEASTHFFNGKSKSWLFAPTTQALYAEHSTQDFSILSIRGSEADELSDLSTDVNFIQKDFASMGKVHSGFFAAYEEIAPQFIEMLKTRSKEKNIRLWITGHSLGGAVATLLTATLIDLKRKGELSNVEIMGLHTIGSPRVGNPVFAKSFDAMTQNDGISVMRTRNRADPITMLPIGFYGNRGYWHIGAFAYIGNDRKLYQSDDPSVIESQSDYNRLKSPTLNDHLLLAYFSAIRDAYLESQGTEKSECTLVNGNHPPKPFYENPADRS